MVSPGTDPYRSTRILALQSRAEPARALRGRQCTTSAPRDNALHEGVEHRNILDAAVEPGDRPMLVITATWGVLQQLSASWSKNSRHCRDGVGTGLPSSPPTARSSLQCCRATHGRRRCLAVRTVINVVRLAINLARRPAAAPRECRGASLRRTQAGFGDGGMGVTTAGATRATGPATTRRVRSDQTRPAPAHAHRATWRSTPRPKAAVQQDSGRCPHASSADADHVHPLHRSVLTPQT